MKTFLNYPIKKQLQKVFACMLLLIFPCCIAGYSQETVSQGATFRVNESSSMNSTQNLRVTAGGTLDVQGTLILKKNLVNLNTAPTSLGIGTIVFSGTVNQTISGQNIIQDMTVNNAAGVTLNGNTRVNNLLTLTTGLITLGSSNLLLGPTASVAGSPTAASMVVPAGSGQLQKEFAAGGNFTFPVGDTTGTAEYSPVTLSFNSGTFEANNYAGVSLINTRYPGTAETAYLTRYWYVTQSGITDFSCNAIFQYVDADVVAPESDIFSFKVSPGLFTAYNVANTSTNQIDAHGLASFGTFTGNLGNAAIPPDVRSLQDKTISSGPECADALQTMLIAGNGTIYLVTGTGNVKHIAGTNIIYYPGTKVDLGGILQGYIS
ncbi:MAG: hypothetical protein NTW16_09010, partial [Bacteroidetes bacterium]|nr:hypothetical protein [Bacteroidota bacterium]